LYLEGMGWVMLRASGTEPMLRVYSEMRMAKDTQKVLEHTCTVVRGL
jgi:phosphomannomutase